MARGILRPFCEFAFARMEENSNNSNTTRNNNTSNNNRNNDAEEEEEEPRRSFVHEAISRAQLKRVAIDAEHLLTM